MFFGAIRSQNNVLFVSIPSNQGIAATPMDKFNVILSEVEYAMQHNRYYHSTDDM